MLKKVIGLVCLQFNEISINYHGDVINPVTVAYTKGIYTATNQQSKSKRIDNKQSHVPV
jgi:hypothetical protein